MNCPIEWRYSNRIHLDAKETLLHVFELSTINTELFFLRVIGHLVYGHPPDISDTILVYLKPLVPCQPACKVPKCWITRSRCWLQHKESQGPALPWIIKVAVCSVTACFLSRTILLSRVAFGKMTPISFSYVNQEDRMSAARENTY